MQRQGVRQGSLLGQLHAWVPGVPVCVRHELYLMTLGLVSIVQRCARR